MKLFAQSQAKKQKVWIDEERAREEREREFRREEAQKNREHELRIAEIYARAFASNNTIQHTMQNNTRHEPNDILSPVRTPFRSQQYHSPTTPVPLRTNVIPETPPPANFSSQNLYRDYAEYRNNWGPSFK